MKHGVTLVDTLVNCAARHGALKTEVIQSLEFEVRYDISCWTEVSRIFCRETAKANRYKELAVNYKYFLKDNKNSCWFQ
jgi:hypothetical protein